jgi:hypothetical protein
MGDELAGKLEVIHLITLNFLPQILVLMQGAAVAGICLAMAADELFRPPFRREPDWSALKLFTAKQQKRRLRACSQRQSAVRGASRGWLSAGGASARVRPSVALAFRGAAFRPMTMFQLPLPIPRCPAAAE